MTKIVGKFSNSTKQFRFLHKSQLLTPDRMNVFQYFYLIFEMEKLNHQSEVKVVRMSTKCQEMCREISENDSELFLIYRRYLNVILTFDFLHIGKEN